MQPLAPPPASGRTSTPVDFSGQTIDQASQAESSFRGAAETLGGPQALPVLPHYLIEGEIGRGGMGVVYRAVEKTLHRTVALKMILAGDYAGPEARLRFLGEAEIIAKLQHPNIVHLYEFSVSDGVPYFSLEFVEGGGLDTLLRKEPLPPAEAAALVGTLARAMHYAHGIGVVHRDLKPANILLKPRPGSSHPGGHSSASNHRAHRGDESFGSLSCHLRDAVFIPKITDFGLAKLDAGGPGVTRSGNIVGTPGYMAPEQARGDVHAVGPAADIYALGAILYEALTGRPPFKSPSALETMQQVIRDEPVPPSRLAPRTPRDLETICLKCLAKEPAKRYASAEGLADDLARFSRGETIHARPVGAISKTLRWTRRRPATAALVAVSGLALAALVLGGWYTSIRLNGALADTRRERAAAEAHAKEADEQRQKVAEAARRQIENFDDIVVNFDGRLANLQNAENIRVEFLDDLRKLSEDLLRGAPDDPTVLKQAARVHDALGELAADKSSEGHYRKAMDLYRKLLELQPDAVVHREKLVKAGKSRAMGLWRSGKLPEAEAAYREAIVDSDALATLPGQRGGAVRSALSRYYLANVLEDLNRPAEAREFYRTSLDSQEKLAASKPEADVYQDIANSAWCLSRLEESGDGPLAAKHCRAGLDAARKALALEPKKTTHILDARRMEDEWFALLNRQGRAADMAAYAAEYAAKGPGRAGNDAYNAACYYGLATGVATGADAEKFGKLAVEYLAGALAAGFEDLPHLLKDTDLDSLRARADYLTLLETKPKPSPAEMAAAYRKEFDSKQEDYLDEKARAVTKAEKARAVRIKPDFAYFADRVLDIEGKGTKDAEDMESLLWVVRSDPGGETAAPAAPLNPRVQRALERLERFADKPTFAKACIALGKCPGPGTDRLLTVAFDKNGDKSVKALAGYFLGTSFATQAAKAFGAEQEKLFQAAEERLGWVAKECEGVKYLTTDIGPLAAKKLREVRTLSVGRPAPTLAGPDLDGKAMSLADQKGKTTLVFYWANWCGFCRQTYPMLEALRKEHDGESLVVLGVNCDEDLNDARAASARHRIPFRSWFNEQTSGGKATEAWQVDGFPAIFLIDSQGIIRKRWSGKPDKADLEKTVDEHLKRPAAAGTGGN